MDRQTIQLVEGNQRMKGLAYGTSSTYAKKTVSSYDITPTHTPA